MSIRRSVMFAVLALSAVALAPTPALATKGGAERPARGTLSGTVTLTFTTPTTGAFVSDFTGVASHFGKYTGHLEGEGDLTSDFTLEGEGVATLTAANGDQLYETFAVSTTPLLPSGHTSTSVGTVTGGTGRFEGATGTLVTTTQVTPLEEPIPGIQFVNELQGTTTGQISY